MNNLKNNFKQIVMNGIVAKKDDKFKVKDRLTFWRQNAENIFDDDLDKLKKAITTVFCSIDPKFELEKEKRAFANLYGKDSPYSQEIRQGLAETLALLGNYPDLLIHCSSHKRDNIASEIVRNIFQDMTWKHWASLSPYLPLFAESAPDTYLSIVANFLTQSQELAQFQSEEGSIFGGGYYMSGIVQSLETLAWEEEYFGRAVNLLFELAIHDQGGNFYPRPQSSLINIFLPWNPQTLVTYTKQIAIAKVLAAKNLSTSWDIISRLLYEKFQVSSGTRRPIWRKSLPENYKREILQKEYWEVVQAYEDILIEIATNVLDITYPKKLVALLEHLTPDSFTKALNTLRSSAFISVSDQNKEAIWSELLKLIIKHQRHSNCDWAFSKNKCEQLKNICENLKPKGLLYQYKYLFDTNRHSLALTDDYTAEEARLDQEEFNAVNEIYSQGEIPAILGLAQNAMRPHAIGHHLAKIGSLELDQKLLPDLLNSPEEYINRFLTGYLSSRFKTEDDSWLKRFSTDSWTLPQKLSFLCNLPFHTRVWYFVEFLLAEKEDLYWQQIQVDWFSSPESEFAVRKSLQYNRPGLALFCLFTMHFAHESIDYDLCAKALLDALKTNEILKVDPWQITQLIKYLQSCEKSSEQVKTLQRIEFAYLPLLASTQGEVCPVTLENALSVDPSFFHEVLCAVYKSENETENTEKTTAEIDLASNADSLLTDWRTIPGISKDGKFEIASFQKWFSEVISLCQKSGRENMAKFVIGKILRHAPQDIDGLWINKGLAAILDQPDNSRIREGFYNATYNARGVHMVDVTGEADKKLAENFHKKASDLEDAGFLEFSITLRGLARNYEEEAKRSIEMGKNRDF